MSNALFDATVCHYVCLSGFLLAYSFDAWFGQAVFVHMYWSTWPVSLSFD